MYERRRRTPLLLIGLLVALLLAGVVGLGLLLVALLRAGMAEGSPLLTALCLGGVMLTALSVGVVLIRVAARQIGDGSSSRRAITIGGMAVLMGCAPFLMILVVYLLARGGGP